ncbi:MAG: hypothetical protein Q4D24_02540 [Erysipelotrichaceae bacterium]|nr:hypothetical protein [Erysipelotrichaceae bacterium]
MYKTENFTPADFKPKRFESDHTITLRGTEIPYHTVSEDNVFYNDDGKPIASIFSYSYFRSDVKDTEPRPVLFGFNGGPGSPSMYVHTGFMGPRRVVYTELNRSSALGPYTVIDNPQCLLDIADLVLVDTVGTGYGVLLDPESGKEFYGIEEDAEAFLTFVESWLHRYNRWLSPKYLIGESYGCTRASVAAGIAATRGKDRSYGAAFDGLVLIGNTVTVGKYYNKEVPVESSVTGFPTFAAVNWYHNHPSDQSLEEFVKEAKAFADKDYLLALYEGENLEGEAREAILEKVSYYTGMSRDYLEARAMKIDDGTFRQEVIKDKNMSAARFDGRFTRPRYIPEKVEESVGIRDDASSDRYGTYFYAALTGAILPALNVKLDRQYVRSVNVIETWNREAPKGTTAEQLRNAMMRIPGMRTFFANGYYDGATEIGIVYYTVSHAGLPKDRVFVKGYPSGHMIYFGEDNIEELCNDIRNFVEGSDPTK